MPFGNGAERVLGNKDTGASIAGLNFNTHTNAHMFRAAQEGIAFSFRYGLDIMKETGINPRIIRAGEANMFLSKFSVRHCRALQGRKSIFVILTDQLVPQEVQELDADITNLKRKPSPDL